MFTIMLFWCQYSLFFTFSFSILPDLFYFIFFIFFFPLSFLFTSLHFFFFCILRITLSPVTSITVTKTTERDVWGWYGFIRPSNNHYFIFTNESQSTGLSKGPAIVELGCIIIRILHIIRKYVQFRAYRNIYF
jgi:hypothetical protein